MELTREQVEARLRALAGADNTPWDAPTLTHMDLLAHDQALRQSRDECRKELEARRYRFTLCNGEHEQLTKERDEYKAKCEAAEERLYKYAHWTPEHTIEEWLADRQRIVDAKEAEADAQLKAQLAQATARVEELKLSLGTELARWDVRCQEIQVERDRWYGQAQDRAITINTLQQRVEELEQAKNDRVNMGMVLGGMASGAIEAERRENASLKQRVAELEAKVRELSGYY